MKNVVIQVENLQALDLDRIHDVTRYHGYAILRGLVQASEIERSKLLLREWFDSQRDRRSRGENPADLETDFIKSSYWVRPIRAVRIGRGVIGRST